ncbi:hypothetical protein HZA71_00665 [Candidatus Falkowbacteria bacterium]|nr:hypothetical protein [Candidatus Falkowbacteria bacterium]
MCSKKGHEVVVTYPDGRRERYRSRHNRRARQWLDIFRRQGNGVRVDKKSVSADKVIRCQNAGKRIRIPAVLRTA